MTGKIKNGLKIVDDINKRLSIDTESVRKKLKNILANSLSKDEQKQSVNHLAENFGCLIEDISGALKKMVKSFITKEPSQSSSNTNDNSLLVPMEIQANSSQEQKLTTAQSLNEEAKKKLLNDSSSEDDSIQHVRIKRKIKKRRTHKPLTGDLVSTDFESSKSSEDADDKVKCKDEPFVESELVDEVLKNSFKGNSTPTTSEPSKKRTNGENDDEFYGFPNSSEIDIGIKTELQQTFDSEPNQTQTHTQSTNHCDNMESSKLNKCAINENETATIGSHADSNKQSNANENVELSDEDDEFEGIVDDDDEDIRK